MVTQVGVYDFEPESKRMRLVGLNPGMTVEIAQACTGFELLVADDLEMIAAPSEEVLTTLRTVVDPRGVFTSLPG